MSHRTPLHCLIPWIGALPILLAPIAVGATVTYTFEANPSLAGQITPDLDPNLTGFIASFGADAPAGTFVLQPANPMMLAYFPSARITTTSLTESNPFGTDHPLVISSNLPFIAVELDWMSFSIPTGGYLQISDGLGKTQTYYDDGTMTFVFTDEFGTTYTNGNVAGTAYFETSAPVTSITITAWDTADAPIPGVPFVQALGVDNVVFTVVPEPGLLPLGLLGAMSLLSRRRSPVS